MKLSQDTLNVLKNFGTINSNLVFRPGMPLATMSEAKTIMASATIEETFPHVFGVYDINELLSVMSMFDDPELKFAEDMNSVSIVQGKRSVKYFFANPEHLTSPSKSITMPSVDLSFSLSADDLNALRKASSALGATDVVVYADEGDGPVCAKVTDIKDATSNSFDIELENVTRPTESFSFVFNINNFKVISGDYNVSISSKLISQFKHTSLAVEYFIALEKSSVFGG